MKGQKKGEEKGIIKRIGGGWIFLLIVCILYLALIPIDGVSVGEAFSGFLNLLTRILPVLGIVFGILFLMNLFVDNKLVLKYLGEGSKRRGWIISIIGGILSAGPIYLWYPLLQELKEKGMRDALIAAFLYNRAVKIPLLPVMVLYFGVKLVVVLTVLMVLFSIVDGIIVEKFNKLGRPEAG